MSCLYQTVPTRTFAITLGDLTFYATSWRLTGQRQLVQQGGATGHSFFTNTSLRAKELELTGFLHFHNTPADVVLALDTAVRDSSRFAFTLREMGFITAMITAYVVEEQAAQGLLRCQLRLMTTSAITKKTADLEVATETEGTT